MAVRKPQCSASPGRRGATRRQENLPEPIVLTAEQSWEEYERSARELLGVTPAEFEERWARGDYEDSDKHWDAVGVWMIRVPRPSA